MNLWYKSFYQMSANERSVDLCVAILTLSKRFPYQMSQKLVNLMISDEMWPQTLNTVILMDSPFPFSLWQIMVYYRMLIFVLDKSVWHCSIWKLWWKITKLAKSTQKVVKVAITSGINNCGLKSRGCTFYFFGIVLMYLFCSQLQEK